MLFANKSAFADSIDSHELITGISAWLWLWVRLDVERCSQTVPGTAEQQSHSQAVVEPEDGKEMSGLAGVPWKEPTLFETTVLARQVVLTWISRAAVEELQWV